MVRTRDFLLGILALGFCVIVTGGQLFSVWFGSREGIEMSVPANVEAQTYTAVITNAEPDYASRITLLRQKLALRDSESIAMPEPEVLEDTSAAVATTSENLGEPLVESETVVQYCANYTKEIISWNPKTITIQDTGFSRIVTTTEVVGTTSRSVVRVTLPKPAVAVVAKICIPFDVVGIALDGSLIRNSESDVYGIFGEGTLIGYALDGVAIYGQSSSLATDACGGAVIDGIYRYYLSDEREGVIGCYAGLPQMVR